MGMDADLIEPEIITSNICSYLTYLYQNVKSWEDRKVQDIPKFNIPPISETVSSVNNLSFRTLLIYFS